MRVHNEPRPMARFGSRHPRARAATGAAVIGAAFYLVFFKGPVSGSGEGPPSPSSRPVADAPVFRVPKPGDPEYADYQEMLAQPAFRSSLENTPGYVLPYDPEWRSMLSGRRHAPPVEGNFTGGAPSLQELGHQLVFAVRNQDDLLFLDLRITREEFLEILWPEFPQSRPYLKIPPDEAWMLQFTAMRDQMGSILTKLGGRNLILDRVDDGAVREFTNFRIHDGVTVTGVDQGTGEKVRVVANATAVERHGRWKFLMPQEAPGPAGSAETTEPG
jgi:hypothetical protein